MCKKFIIGITIFICGVFLTGLSGLQKVIMISSVIEISKTKNFSGNIIYIPDYIWNISNWTFVIGLIMVVTGIVLVVISKQR